MDGSGESTAAQRVTDLRAQLAAAEAEAGTAGEQQTVAGASGAVAVAGSPAAATAAAAPAPGDGTRPQDGQASATAEGTGAIAAAPAAEAGAGAEHRPVIDLLKEAAAESQDSPHGFIESLRAVAAQLEADGRLVATDLVGSGELNKITATVVKALGELIAKV